MKISKMAGLPKAIAAVLFLGILAQGFESYSIAPVAAVTTTCPPPYNARLAGVGATSISVAWSSTGATSYKLWLVKEDNSIIGPVTTTNTSYTFTGLSAGSYDVYCVSVCDEECSDEVIIATDVVLG